MKKYACHKVVHAAEIVSVQPSATPPTLSYRDQGGPSKMEVPPTFFARGVPEPGDMLMIYDKGTPGEYISWSPREKFDAGYSGLPLQVNRILRSADNPNGLSLEELFAFLRQELFGRQVKARSRDAAEAVIRNNKRILSLLEMAEDFQRDTLAILRPRADDRRYHEDIHD